MHVLVAGGGVGGLCLAQGLRKAGVEVTVFERDAAIATREQGYRIHIDANGNTALRQCLPPELFALYLATSNKPGPALIRVLDQSGHQLTEFTAPGGDDAHNYETGKPFATKGDPARLAAYEASWQQSPKFRQVLTGVTVGWGIGFLLVSVATVAIVLHFPPDQVSSSFALSQLPSIAVFIALIAFTRLRVRTIRPIVAERMRVSPVSQ